MEEIWKDIIGYEGLYKISSFGKIIALPKSVHIKTKAGWEATRHMKEKNMSLLNSHGYLAVQLSDGKKKKRQSVHRLVGKMFVNNPLNKQEINHIDGNKSNNHYSNLEWCTRSENLYHAYSTGLRIPSQTNKSGKLHHNSKSTIQLFSNGDSKTWESMNEAAINLKLGRSNICSAIKRNGKCGGYKWKYAS
jgi:hypothetical protein